MIFGPGWRRIMKLRILLGMCWILGAACICQARVPALINYQGKLRQGGNLMSGDINIKFKVYDAPVGGTLIWESLPKLVHASNGIFNTYFGDYSVGAVFSNVNWDSYSSTYLELEVAGTVLSPRVQLASSLYAVLAGKVSSNAVTAGMLNQQMKIGRVGGWFRPGLSCCGRVRQCPPGWFECNGQSLAKSDHPELYNALKNGGGMCIYSESALNFKVPDLRGQFVRGWDHGAAMDPDAAGRSDRGDGTAGNNNGTRQGMSSRAIIIHLP